MQTTCAVLTPRAVWCRARATAGLTKLCQLLALSAWHVIAQERSAGSSGKQISALRIEISDQNFLAASSRSRSELKYITCCIYSVLGLASPSTPEAYSGGALFAVSL